MAGVHLIEQAAVDREKRIEGIILENSRRRIAWQNTGTQNMFLITSPFRIIGRTDWDQYKYSLYSAEDSEVEAATQCILQHTQGSLRIVTVLMGHVDLPTALHD